MSTVEVRNSLLFRSISAALAVGVVGILIGLWVARHGSISMSSAVPLGASGLVLAALGIYGCLPQRIRVDGSDLVSDAPFRRTRRAPLGDLRYEIYQPGLAGISVAVRADRYVRVSDSSGRIVADATYPFSTRSLVALVQMLESHGVPGDASTGGRRHPIGEAASGAGESPHIPQEGLTRKQERIVLAALVAILLSAFIYIATKAFG